MNKTSYISESGIGQKFSLIFHKMISIFLEFEKKAIFFNYVFYKEFIELNFI